MSDKVFVAGATGAIGSVLVPLLVQAGYAVYGSTRHAARAETLKAAGAQAVVVDVFDGHALNAAIKKIGPVIVIHQLTDLPRSLDPKAMAEAVVKNARIRTEGTRNLVAAALAAGASRLIAQSIAWAYAPSGSKPYTEDQALDAQAEGARAISVGGVVALENAVLGAGPMTASTVLRYGQIYGPGTSNAEPAGVSPVHVQAAAHAALLALQHAATGIFNITEDNTDVSNAKARQQLGWDPAFRMSKKGEQ